MKNQVKKHRQLANYTQQDLADLIGVSRQTIYAIEAGKYIPSTVLALKLASEFKCEVSVLFSLEPGE